MELEVKRTGVELKLFELTQRIVSEEGYKLYDMVYTPSSSTLRVFIMDTETKSAVIEDCIKVDRAFNPYCETEEWIPDDFTLEVSSPGVYRTLKNREHFLLSTGEIILCTITGELLATEQEKLSKGMKKNKKFRGSLKDVLENKIILDIEGVDLQIGFEQIKKASLDPDLDR